MAMQSTPALILPDAPTPQLTDTAPISLPDHQQLPESDGTFVKNFQEHPQSIVLTTSIEPVLQKLHPDGRYCIGQDSGIYWRLTEPLEKGAESPDWFYVPNVAPLLNGEYRRSYVLWKEFVAPLIAIEFVSGNGSEERDHTPPGENNQVGKFWVYEQAIRIPFYAIFEAKKAAVEVYHLVDGRYEQLLPNDRGHYPIAAMGVELGIKQDGGVPWLRWWDQSGNLLLTGDERAVRAEAIVEQERLAKEQAEQRQQEAEQRQQEAEQRQQEAEQKAERLAEKLRELGIDPDRV
jgi:Uma2 family endonuclease